MGAAYTCPDLTVAFAAGKRRFPSVVWTFEYFAGRCALHPELMFPDDFFWALACAERNTAALAAFEADIMPSVPNYLRPLRMLPDAVEDFLQDFRIQLLYSATPLVARFSGKGPLRPWVRTTATRAAIRFQMSTGRGRQMREGEDTLAKLADPAAREAIGAMLESHKDQLKAAFEEAIDALDQQERVILRMYVLEGVNIDGIGKLYGVHRATVARWIVAIRSKLLSFVHLQLGVRLKVSAIEADSLFRQFAGDISISVSKVLGR